MAEVKSLPGDLGAVLDKRKEIHAMVLACALATVFNAYTENAEAANTSNDLQNDYTSQLFDSNERTNDTLLRGALHVTPIDFICVPQLLRATLPVSTRADPHRGFSAGFSDLNSFDIFLLKTDSAGSVAGDVSTNLGEGHGTQYQTTVLTPDLSSRTISDESSIRVL